MSDYDTGPGTVWVRRPWTLAHSCADSNGVHHSAWKVSGTQTVVADELAPPEAVPDRELVSSGDTVLFTLQSTWGSTQFIGSGNGWHWVSDTTTNTSQLLNCTRLQLTCRAIVRERGHVQVDNVVVEGLGLTARSRIIEVGSARVRIRSTTGVFATRPQGTGGTSTLELEISVEGTDGSALPNRVVDLTVDGVEGSGGHVHGGTMPPGTLSAMSVNTEEDGVATVTYSAGAFARDVRVKGTSTGAASALETITVRVPGLAQLFEAGNVDTIGPTTEHPSGHWGTVTMINALIELCDAFYAYTLNTRKLQINDLSLILGGKFDVAPEPINYNAAGDHEGHRVGRNADVRTQGSAPLTDDQRDFVFDWWVTKFGQDNVFVHTGSNAHYHLTAP